MKWLRQHNGIVLCVGLAKRYVLVLWRGVKSKVPLVFNELLHANISKVAVDYPTKPLIVIEENGLKNFRI